LNAGLPIAVFGVIERGIVKVRLQQKSRHVWACSASGNFQGFSVWRLASYVAQSAKNRKLTVQFAKQNRGTAPVPYFEKARLL
jgi:hypothetical protein